MIQIDTVTFTDQGLVIAYLDTEELRVSGKVRVAHQVQLHASHPDYRVDMQDLHEQAVRVVENALEDWRDSPPHTEDDDVDEDAGMGF